MPDTVKSDADTSHRTERYQRARHVTLVGAIVNALLSVFKIMAGWLGNSQALVADGVHSLSDLATDALVLVVSKISSKGADEDHPYGHARIETAATAGLALILIGVAVGIGWPALQQLLAPIKNPPPTAIALVVAVVSVFSKEVLFHYTMRVAKALRSTLLQANAWHHRSDAVSSLVVVAGIIGSMLSWQYLDALASLVVAVMIAMMGAQLGWSALRELTDSGLDQEALDTIEQTIIGVEGVCSMHDLRTRSMGGQTYADVDVMVDPRLSVSEGHRIGDEVRDRLYRDVALMSDITVHIDPEDDRIDVNPSLDLPLRHELLERLHQHWQTHPEHSAIKEITLHYLEGQIEVLVQMPFEVAADLQAAKAIQQRFAQCATQIACVSRIRVLFD